MNTELENGRSPSGRAGGPADLSPASGSQPEALVPNAEGEPRLRYMGPMDGGFGMELEGGPIHGFAAYLIELMTGPDGKLWNCMETEVQASDCRGSFTLTVQRRNGKTPLQVKAEAEQQVARLRETLQEAQLQLEYLDGRFPTGTTPPIIDRIERALRDTL